MERAFLPVTSPNKPVELVTLPKTELVWATFCRMFLLKLKAPWCACVSPRTKKNAPYTEGGSPPGNSFTWLKHLKGIPPHLLWIEFWKPSHDHIAWATGWVLSCAASSQLPSQCSIQLSGQPLWTFFSHIKAMVRCSGKGSWEMWISRAGPGTDSWGQLHIWETSLWICYVSCTSPDVLCLEEMDRPCCETVGNI